MTSVCMTVATNRDVSKDNDTAKQIASKVEFLRNLAKQMEDAMHVIASCPADSHIRVKGNKTISELSSDLAKSDIQEIEFLGIANIFELEIFKPEVRYSPFMEIFIGACAILQMAAGLMITVGSVGAASSFGASIFAEGIMDAYRLARGEGGVDLKEYFTQKGISYACMGVQVGIGKLASSASAKAAAGKLMEESAKQGISLTTEQAKALVATHALEVSATAAASQTARGELIEQAIKVAGTQVAMAIGTQILAEKVSGFVRKSAFEGLEERISSRIENASYDELGRHMSLTDAKAQIEQDQLLRAEGRIAAKLLHEPRNMRIVKELSRAVLSTVTSHALSGSSRLAALATNFAISGMQSAASSTDIMPLADELADEVRVEIATKDTAAKTRLAREKQAGNKDAVAKAEGDEGNRRNLSHRLGEIGASYIMSAVEGRVIAPIVSVAAGKVIDMAVGTYMRAQEELLREYHSQYHAAKATAVMGVAAGDSGAVGANGQAEEEVEGLPWLDQDGDGNNTSVTRKDGGKGRGSEKLDGLPWLDENGEGNNSGVAKKAGGKWAGGFSEDEIVVSKPHIQKAKAALKLTSKTPSAVQRAEEEAAGKRVIAAIKLKEQMLGMPVTDEELSALALTSERPIYITENGKYQAAFGTSIKGKPVVVEREAINPFANMPQFNDISDMLSLNPPTSGPNALINELFTTPYLHNTLGENNISYDGTLNTNSNHSMSFCLFSEVEASGAISASNSMSVPMLEAMAVKYGPKVAKGFMKMAPKLALRAIPGVGAAVIASDVYDLYQHMMSAPDVPMVTTETVSIPGVADITYERRGDSEEVAIRKVEVKEQFKALAVAEAKELGTCDALKALSIDQLAQIFDDTADKIVPEVIEQNLPDPWNNKANVIGIIKHEALKNINDGHNKRCDDWRLESEVPYKKEFDLRELPKDQKTPGYTKGSIRVDLLTNTKAHPELDKVAYDAKFGKEGMTNPEINKYIEHLGPDVTIKELRPTDKGGITTKHVGIKQ